MRLPFDSKLFECRGVRIFETHNDGQGKMFYGYRPSYLKPRHFIVDRAKPSAGYHHIDSKLFPQNQRRDSVYFRTSVLNQSDSRIVVYGRGIDKYPHRFVGYIHYIITQRFGIVQMESECKEDSRFICSTITLPKTQWPTAGSKWRMESSKYIESNSSCNSVILVRKSAIR